MQLCVFSLVNIASLWLNIGESFMLQLDVTVVRAWQTNLLIVPFSELRFFSEGIGIRGHLW